MTKLVVLLALLASPLAAQVDTVHGYTDSTALVPVTVRTGCYRVPMLSPTGTFLERNILCGIPKPVTPPVDTIPPVIPPPVTGLAWFSNATNGTGTAFAALHDGGKWATTLTGGSELTLMSVIPATGRDFPTANIWQVNYRGTPRGSPYNYQLTSGIPVSTATVPAVGQYWFVRYYYRNEMPDGQDIGEAHWFQTHSYNSWTFKHGTASGGKFEFRIVTDLTGGYADNKNYVVALNRGTTYVVEMRIQKVTTTTGRISMRVSSTSGTVLFDDNAFHTYNGASETLALLKPVTPVDNAAFTNLDMGNNDPDRAGNGSFYVGAFAIRVSADPNAWIGR